MEKTALETQIGGNHYKKYGYQPIEFFMDHQFNAALTYAMKYVSRYPDKNPDDLEKALHCLNIFSEWVTKKLDSNESYPIVLPLLSHVHEFISQFDAVKSSALLALMNCNDDYFDSVDIEGVKGYKAQTPNYRKLVINVNKAKVAIMEMQKYYETRT